MDFALGLDNQAHYWRPGAYNSTLPSLTGRYGKAPVKISGLLKCQCYFPTQPKDERRSKSWRSIVAKKSDHSSTYWSTIHVDRWLPRMRKGPNPILGRRDLYWIHAEYYRPASLAPTLFHFIPERVALIGSCQRRRLNLQVAWNRGRTYT